MHGSIWRVLSVVNLFHKRGDFGYVGVSLGMQGALGQAKPLGRCGVEHHDFRPLAQRLGFQLKIAH